ncbi:MAG: hypothetical protein ABSF48_08240 [Thermodesulfobacteriota bacterium]|jgi:hypothetical protein
MELIILSAAAGVVWLYLFNATACYAVVGGGYLALVMSMIISRTRKARKLKVGMESVNTFETKAAVTPFHRAKGLGNIQVQG